MDLDNVRLLPPRVMGEFGPMPLADILRDLLAQNKYQVINLDGPGRTTALRYVRNLASEEGLAIAVTDGWQLPEQTTSIAMLRVTADCPGHVDRVFYLCEWGRDEFIEYLLKFHPDQCKRVMGSLSRVDTRYAAGSPFVWQPYLEWLATHDELIGPDQYVFNELETELASPTLTEIADRLLSPKKTGGVEQSYSGRVMRWLRLDDVQQMLMAKRLAEHVRAHNRVMLKHRWPGSLLKATARELASDPFSSSDLPKIIEFLQRSTDKSRYSSMAVSLLNQLVAGWKPHMRRAIDLSWCDFRGAKWSGCGLRGANLRAAQLSAADLTGADLRETSIHKARFSRAAMSDVRISRVQAREVSFSDANLTRADFSHSHFTEADFQRAILKETHFEYCSFDRVDMRRVDWRGVIASNCGLYAVRLEEADLSGANFQNSYFKLVRFKGASLQRANFGEATFVNGADLELLDLSGCNFAGTKLQGAYLTDSTASQASFRMANLAQAGLAGVVWENCDLRGADLRGAAFHMGSTRCGLVDSPYPSHGTRTGFYTDDYVDLSFKHPEQVRKAALIGCDLRGALLIGCDFYLVDVRECQLDPEQRELMASCGAILE